VFEAVGDVEEAVKNLDTVIDMDFEYLAKEFQSVARNLRRMNERFDRHSQLMTSTTRVIREGIHETRFATRVFAAAMYAADPNNRFLPQPDPEMWRLFQRLPAEMMRREDDHRRRMEDIEWENRILREAAARASPLTEDGDNESQRSLSEGSGDGTTGASLSEESGDRGSRESSVY
jgi:hypothetical protein